MGSENVIIEKVLDFGVSIVAFCELLDEKKKFVISKQLLRSGTSIGASVFEAQHPESRADFVHKMKIAMKEASETMYWLMICERSKNYPTENILKEKVAEIMRIINKIILSSKGKFA